MNLLLRLAKTCAQIVRHIDGLLRPILAAPADVLAEDERTPGAKFVHEFKSIAEYDKPNSEGEL